MGISTFVSQQAPSIIGGFVAVVAAVAYWRQKAVMQRLVEERRQERSRG